MRYFWTLFLIIGCQDFNSNSFDKQRYAPLVIEDPALAVVYPIIQNNCFNCHNYHQEWAGYTTPADWLAARGRDGRMLINPGDPQGSYFIQRIINSGQPGNNMPLNRGPLPQDQYLALRNWIENL